MFLRGMKSGRTIMLIFEQDQDCIRKICDRRHCSTSTAVFRTF